MKVIQLTPWYSPYIGGVELHVKSISEGLRRIGCNVKIFTFTCPRMLQHLTSAAPAD